MDSQLLEQVLPTLNETNLNESAGIGGNANMWVKFPLNSKSDSTVSMDVPVDWNQSGPPASGPLVHVQADINGDGQLSTLVGYDDWVSLQYNFLGTANFQAVIPTAASIDPGDFARGI